MPLVATRGPKFGRCNICAKRAKLSADHVPPKGTNRFTRVQLHRVVDALGVEGGASRKGRLFQSGVKFRTICETCNSEVLGGKFDPVLVKFANQVSGYLHSQLQLPEIARIQVRPGYLIRAVFGHLLAIGVERYPRGDMGDAMAGFVLDDQAELDQRLGVYYWLYPYWDQVAIRGCCMLVKWGAPSLMISVLKFTPIAFLVTWEADPRLEIPYPNLANFTIGAGSAETVVPLNFRLIPPERYPEAPGDHGVVLHGEDSLLARRAK